MKRTLLSRIFGNTPEASPAGNPTADIHALLESGDLEKAARLCQEMVNRHPDHLETLLLTAEVAVRQHDAAHAIATYTNAIRFHPQLALLHYKLGNLYRDTNQFELALQSYDRAIAHDPRYANAYCNRGVTLECLARPEMARASYDQAISLNPSDAFAYHNRAGILRAQSRPDDALADYERAVALNPGYLEAECNRALLLVDLERFQEALAGYERCLSRNPRFFQAHFNRGALRQRMAQPLAALTSYDSALEANPLHADTHNNRGVVLTHLGRWEDALNSYDRAIVLNPGLADAYGNRAGALVHLNRFEPAIADYVRALALNPQGKFLVGALMHAKLQLCEWRDFDADLRLLEAKLAGQATASHPFHLLGLIDSPSLHQRSAVAWMDDMYPPNDALGGIPRRQRRKRIRVGYFSADFRDHAVAHLIADLFDLHDRSRFEIIGVSLGPGTEDAYRQRFKRTCDAFLDVGALSDVEIASRARALELDIAVDLGGLTALSKPGIFAARAAPLQVNYLGYPGTMGASYYDYIIADRSIVPERNQHLYTESIVYLPNSYQPNSARVVAEVSASRVALGLPATGFVFCCFNNNFKLLPATFDSWARILRATPASVLWLRHSNERVSTNLREQAALRGIDADRLIFAPRVSAPEHLARHRSADLFLDTFPYNAHTTASDALLAGLPLITCAGESYASRVAASLLRAVGLQELVVETMTEYERLAIALAADPGRLANIRSRLLGNRAAEPLFDIRTYTCNLEAGYDAIQERRLAGLPAATLHVSPTERQLDTGRATDGKLP